MADDLSISTISRPDAIFGTDRYSLRRLKIILRYGLLLAPFYNLISLKKLSKPKSAAENAPTIRD
jgi:hypothetical protein